MKKRRNVPVFVILTAMVFIVLALALRTAGDNQTPSLDTSQPPSSQSLDPDSTDSLTEELFPPGVEGNLDSTQQSAFERLKTESRIQPSMLVVQGVVRFITLAVPVPDSAATDLHEKAYIFLRRNSDLLNLDNTAQNLKVEATSSGRLGNEQVIFSQVINGIPVYGAKLRVHFNNLGEVALVNGAYTPGVVPASAPVISVEQAQQYASQSLGVTDAVVSTPPSLMYFDEAVFGEGISGPRLIWQVLLTSDTTGEWEILVDANSGEIIREYSDIQDWSREVRDNHGAPREKYRRSTKIMNADGCLPYNKCDTDAQNAFDYSGAYATFLEKMFDRNSYDGKGTKIVSYVHVGDFFSKCEGTHGPNAAWGGKGVFYSDGYSSANDVVAHELTHALIESEGGLKYEKESGALNESYADVFAVLLDNGDSAHSWVTSDWVVTDWLLGEDLSKVTNKAPFRDLSNPPMGQNPPHQPDILNGDGYKKLEGGEKPDPCKNDNGYVHTNSGITNKAAYLLIQPNTITFNDITVKGIGPRKLAQIYYYALTNYLHSTWTFHDARNSTISACIQLSRNGTVEFEDCKQVVNAFAAVGIGKPVVQPSQVTPSPLPISLANSSTILVFDSSGSMNELDQSGKTKLDAAKAAGANILDLIKAEGDATGAASAQVGLVDFNFYAQVDTPLTADISAAEAALQGLFADGGTGMPDGLKTALDLLPATATDRQSIVILLSDGLPNIGHGNNQSLDQEEVKQQVLEQAVRAGEMGVCIYTVGFGVPGAIGSVSRENSIDEDLLRQIFSTAGCGSYYNAENANQLANVYVELRHVSTGNLLLRQTGQIAQDQQVDIGQVDLPANQAMLLYTLNWPGSRLDPVLVDPAGRTVDINYPGASISTSDTLASVIIDHPRRGQWRVAAQGVDVPEGVTTYNALLSSRVETTITTGSPGLPLAVVILMLVGSGVGIYTITRKTSQKRDAAVLAKGSQGALLIGIQGEMAGRNVSIKTDALVIGRSSSSGLQLRGSSVSRQHAAIRYAQGSWFIQDLGSSGGTFVNGQRVQAIKLNPGDQIAIGGSVFVFQKEEGG